MLQERAILRLVWLLLETKEESSEDRRLSSFQKLVQAGVFKGMAAPMYGSICDLLEEAKVPRDVLQRIRNEGGVEIVRPAVGVVLPVHQLTGDILARRLIIGSSGLAQE